MKTIYVDLLRLTQQKLIRLNVNEKSNLIR